MGWRDRVHDILRTGGALALGGCLNGQACCNANPDPCCGLTDDSATWVKMECAGEQACAADGGIWHNGWSTGQPDGDVPGFCASADAGLQTPASDSGRD
jgi:hypothetical protein